MTVNKSYGVIVSTIDPCEPAPHSMETDEPGPVVFRDNCLKEGGKISRSWNRCLFSMPVKCLP